MTLCLTDSEAALAAVERICEIYLRLKSCWQPAAPEIKARIAVELDFACFVFPLCHGNVETVTELMREASGPLAHRIAQDDVRTVIAHRELAYALADVSKRTAFLQRLDMKDDAVLAPTLPARSRKGRPSAPPAQMS